MKIPLKFVTLSCLLGVACCSFFKSLTQQTTAITGDDISKPLASHHNFNIMLRSDSSDSRRRRRRYVLSKEKWPKHTLKWKLHQNRLSLADMFIIRATLHRAFEMWSSVSSLKFIEVISNDKNSIGPVDIDILFLSGKHGDGLPFDGPQGVVAHAFYPPVGALHFDADESWTLNKPHGINLFQTAVHEIGHILGLEHSTDFRAVMYPRNRKFEANYQLSDDDVRAIRRLYGKS